MAAGKFGVNSKAEEGRARKAAQKETKKREEEKKREEIEIKSWAEGSRQVSAKKTQDEERRAQKLKSKEERDRIEAAEAAELSKYRIVSKSSQSKSHTHPPSIVIKKETINDSSKLMRSLSRGSSFASEIQSTTVSSTSINIDSPSASENGSVSSIYSASNIDDAIFLLGSTSGKSEQNSLERHPERRLKAAFAAFEEREMPNLKAEYPGLRLSQLKEKLHRMWLKSPDNPFNKAHISHRATKEQEQLHAEAIVEAGLHRLKLSKDQ